VRIEIIHETVYTFSRPVFLEPHVVRLQPRSDGSQHLESFRLEFHPEPAGMTDCLDCEGNTVRHAWFNGTAETLEITARTSIETLRSNPFDFIIAGPDRLDAPDVYPAKIQLNLAPYRQQDASDAAVAALGESLKSESGDSMTQFLINLTERLYREIKVVIREEGDPMPARETLEKQEGSCRDLAVLFIEVCRWAGLAARFVSGYQCGDPDQTERYLHAWAEVYLPGAGWRGYDPTHGLVVADGHVPIAAAASPKGAAPVVGNFRGTSATSTMHSTIELTATLP
jgi:transglutaminase-like putative cysteine protease